MMFTFGLIVAIAGLWVAHDSTSWPVFPFFETYRAWTQRMLFTVVAGLLLTLIGLLMMAKA